MHTNMHGRVKAQVYLDAQFPVPELAICSTTSHCTEHIWIDLDDFLNTEKLQMKDIMGVISTRVTILVYVCLFIYPGIM